MQSAPEHALKALNSHKNNNLSRYIATAPHTRTEPPSKAIYAPQASEAYNRGVQAHMEERLTDTNPIVIRNSSQTPNFGIFARLEEALDWYKRCTRRDPRYPPHVVLTLTLTLKQKLKLKLKQKLTLKLTLYLTLTLTLIQHARYPDVYINMAAALRSLSKPLEEPNSVP